MMIDYDITGFVNFPNPNLNSIQTVDSGKTAIYIIVFNSDFTKDSALQKLELSGKFCGDDVSPIRNKNLNNLTDVINEMKGMEIDSKSLYFKGNKKTSIPLVSCVLIGWSKYTYEYSDKLTPWCCSFRDLTNEGRKLYYSLKKLHNEKEIRMLTFNNIKK